MFGDFAATIINFWADFSATCQFWIGSAILDLTGHVSNHLINYFIFYGLVLTVLLAFASYIRMILVKPPATEH